MVNGGDVPVEWSEKNVIVKAPESNPAISALKRPRGNSPSSEDKPKKARRQKAGVEKSKAGSPKPPMIAQSSSGVAQVTKFGAPADVPAGSLSPTKHYRRKTSAGRIQIFEISEEVSFQNPYLLTIFLFCFSLSFLLCLHPLALIVCFYGCNSLVKKCN